MNPTLLAEGLWPARLPVERVRRGEHDASIAGHYRGVESVVPTHAVPMAVIWPLVLLAVFFPLSVRAYRRLGR